MHTRGPLSAHDYSVYKDGKAMAELIRQHDLSPSRQKQTARLLAAAYTSYDRVFGEGAIEAAESDALATAVALLRRLHDAEDGVMPEVSRFLTAHPELAKDTEGAK